MEHSTFLAVQLLGPKMPPAKWLFEHVYQAGFNGVEILLTKHVLRNLQDLTDEALLAGLDVSFHRWWPTGGDGWHNKLVTPYLFPDAETRIWDVLPDDFPDDVVVSSHDATSKDEYFFLEHGLFQPTPTGVEFEGFAKLKRWMHERQTRLVFDVGHWLQCAYWPGCPDIYRHGQAHLLQCLTDEFSDWRHQVDEIHVYGIEKFDASSMNRWPWNSPRLDVGAFLDHVHASGWKGRVVWEIHPFQLFRPGGFKKLERLAAYR